MATKKSGNTRSPLLETVSSSQGLIICRNKHWRYISSFHGPWLQLPLEVLESLAHQNFSMPAPRLIDPAVFYDLVKIRKLVDEAAQDSVRASAGVSHNAGNARMEFLGGGGNVTPLSRQRIFKIRQKAAKLLAEAYALDEVAASVATMQSTSTVDDLGSHVLKKEPSNPDAKYVHFFHEKIPSRAVEQFTSLEAISEIVASAPMQEQAAPLRTRALVQILKHQCEGAVLDLTLALKITEEMKRVHRPGQQQLELARKMRDEQDAWQKSKKDWRSIPLQKEEDQPRSLEAQLHFNRAGAYLTMACDNIQAALDGLQGDQASQRAEGREEEELKAHALRLEARKKVKVYAKRALKDYSAFLSHLDYTPVFSLQTTDEVMRQDHNSSNGRDPRAFALDSRLPGIDAGRAAATSASNALVHHGAYESESSGRKGSGWSSIPNPKIHRASDLFAERPPADLPQLPTLDRRHGLLDTEQSRESFGSREAVTYHPLLTDALHSLLLAHALAQTSPTELLRHAHNVARLARIAHGYPLFHAARSPARADWIEVLRRADNWLGLTSSWQNLCAPATSPATTGGRSEESSREATYRSDEAPESRGDPRDETLMQRRERVKQESIVDALSDERVVDEESFQHAVRAREIRALEDESDRSRPLISRQVVTAEPNEKLATSSQSPSPSTSDGGQMPPPKRTADDIAREYLISTDRAHAIARWIRESPLSMASAGGTKKRRAMRQRKKSAPMAHDKAVDHIQAMEELDIVGDTGVDDGPDCDILTNATQIDSL